MKGHKSNAFCIYIIFNQPLRKLLIDSSIDWQVGKTGDLC